MKPVIIIAIIVGISVVSIFVISEIIWYFANQEFEQARDEIKENLALLFRFWKIQSLVNYKICNYCNDEANQLKTLHNNDKDLAFCYTKT